MDPSLDHSYTLATININAIQSQTKLAALSAFIRMLELDIVCLQEVASNNISVSGYDSIINIDERRRGTAVLVKNGIRVSQVRKSLDSRLICTTLENAVTIVNIYAPSGTNNRYVREDFFNRVVPQYILNTATYLIVTGDFNSITDARDATGGTNISPNLKRLVQAQNLTDAWRLFNNFTDYTFVRGQSMSRIDTIYVNQPIVSRIRHCRIQVNCFSDHKAVVMRVVLPFASQRPPRPPWKLNNNLLTTSNIEELQRKWTYWKRTRQNYRSWVDWWVNFVKGKLVSFFKWKQNQFYTSYSNTIGFYYSCLNRAYAAHLENDNTAEINRIKAVMLRKQKEFNGFFRKESANHLPDEETSIFQIDDHRKRQEGTKIENLEINGRLLNDPHDIETAVYEHYRSMFAGEEVDNRDAFHPTRAVPLNIEANDSLMDRITEDEVYDAIKFSAPYKSPGKDGLTREFFVKLWGTIKAEIVEIINEMKNGQILPEQLEGIIVLVHKKSGNNSISSYRPISLLNVDYKILTRVLKERLNKVVPLVLSNEQKCSNGKRNIFEATCLIRDEIGHTHRTGRNGLVMACDLSSAFDRVNYDFLLNTLRRMNINNDFVNLMTTFMGHSKSQLVVNGKLTESFDINCSVRQGDPLSMLLFVVYLQPLLDRLSQICNDIGESITAYADDITIIIKHPRKTQLVIDCFRQFGVASGARLNLQKTVGLKLGTGFTTPEELIISEEVNILGVLYKNTIENTVAVNWAKLRRSITSLLWLNRARLLNIKQRIWLINTYICSKLWYLSSILPLPLSIGKLLKQQITKFVWFGVPHRVRYEQIIKTKVKGGLGLHCPIRKSKSLLVNRFQRTRELLPYQQDYANRTRSRRDLRAIPEEMSHFKEIIGEVLKLPSRITEGITAHKIYDYSLELLPENRIEQSVQRDWSRVWKNINHKNLSSEEKAVYYLLCNDKLDNNSLRFRENRLATPSCDVCQAEETIEHKYSTCPTVEPLWRRIAVQISSVGIRSNQLFKRLQFPELLGVNKRTISRIVKLFVRYVIFVTETPIENLNVQNLEFYMTMYS